MTMWCYLPVRLCHGNADAALLLLILAQYGDGELRELMAMPISIQRVMKLVGIPLCCVGGIIAMHRCSRTFVEVYALGSRRIWVQPPGASFVQHHMTGRPSSGSRFDEVSSPDMTKRM